METYLKQNFEGMRKECRTCKYGDTVAQCYGFFLKTGRSRIGLHGGDWRNLIGPCKERVPGKPMRPRSEPFTFPFEKEEKNG